jgi:hypothetical protein
MQRPAAPDFSIVTPHRGNPKDLKAFYEMVFETTIYPENMEIILLVDDDDPACHNLEAPGLTVNQLIFPHGTLGPTYLNSAYRAARGKLITLLPTDTVIQTSGWDVEFLDEFAKWPDGIGLVYANDLIFKEMLAEGGLTVSRKACQIIGHLTHPAYRWFRADDHIHHTYDILRHLGHDRISYLPDTIFEHLSYVEIDGQRIYDKSPMIVGDIQSDDGRRYQELHTERLLDALKLAMFIDPSKFNDYMEAAKNLPGPFFHYLNVQAMKQEAKGEPICINVNGKMFPVESYRGYSISPCLDEIRKE